MVGRWMTLPYIFILTLLIPEYHTIRIIDYGTDTDRDTDDLVVERFASESCEGEDSVSFAGFNIMKVPETAIKSKTIKNINLKENLLESIPTELFDNVPLLECLNVAVNKIPYNEIFNFGHSSLKKLVVDYQRDVDHFNMLQSRELNYPKAHFPKLEMLHVNGISTFVLDMFPKSIFPQLTTLYLTENGLRHIDADFMSKLPTSIQNLHLERNDIYNFNDVYNVGNLISLYLDGNPIQSISSNSNHSFLQILSLSNCNLTTVTLENQFKIALNNLEVLDLSQNRLKYIPEYLFDNAVYLQDLLLSHNSLTEIPRIHKLRQLNKLSLSYNHIGTVYINYLISDTLTVLNLQSNNISEIADSSFINVPALQELDLSDNKLKYLTPGWENGLNNLKQLNLRFNMFASIADMSLTSLVDLKNLYIKGNLFHEMDEYALKLIPQTCTTYVM